MPFELQAAADEVKLILAGKLGVQQARDLWDALQPAAAAGHNIRLYAAGLEEMDTSILQILCRASRLSGGLKIAESSEGFLTALKRRGLENSLRSHSRPVRRRPLLQRLRFLNL